MNRDSGGPEIRRSISPALWPRLPVEGRNHLGATRRYLHGAPGAIQSFSVLMLCSGERRVVFRECPDVQERVGFTVHFSDLTLGRVSVVLDRRGSDPEGGSFAPSSGSTLFRCCCCTHTHPPAYTTQSGG
ncbi:unnamed protein product [Pleuronectes platessa]|uniref:Uncharacterized protein n=1 Tax=Pleuronectes platessa TaxID=8262 RepID=A0A9N7VVZ0_PLEPL|nr:unnamed protein product [Pleuronectes platessa]